MIFFQRALERGRPGLRPLSLAWERLADPVRPLELPSGARVIGVGGATLGGSGKTPVVLELARRLAPDGVAVVASNYRARVGGVRVVSAHDPVELVGDEAALLARALAPLGVPVIAGRVRDEAVALAARHAPTLLVDALLQARPRRLHRSILVLDGERPWGSGACPPAGDLRARREALLAAADSVLVLSRSGTPAELRPGWLVARSEIAGATSPDGRAFDPAAHRLGLVLAIAHPERVLRSLAELGIEPVAVRLFADHAWPQPARPPAPVDAWLTTAKCATKLGAAFEGAPVWTLRHAIRLPDALFTAIAPGQRAMIESAPCFPTDS
jgi:tetraacyldisaccharide 4'-kinase